MRKFTYDEISVEEKSDQIVEISDCFHNDIMLTRETMDAMCRDWFKSNHPGGLVMRNALKDFAAESSASRLVESKILHEEMEFEVERSEITGQLPIELPGQSELKGERK